MSANRVVITGGAGFVGANLADWLLLKGEQVVLVDNFSRKGVERNLQWLEHRHPGRLEVVRGDVRDADLLRSAIEDAGFVFHFAAQVAVTTSRVNPREDHDINVLGTLNVLEAVRRARRNPGVVFASTNKVYGALDDVPLRLEGGRYVPEDAALRSHGIDERQALEFLGPYGCSKGAADQYVLDYCRSFRVAAVVLRMSCIYGPRQHATGVQGWVTHFLASALRGDGLTIFGDGCQVRDILYIDDFVAALGAARLNLPRLCGRPFNIGGGPRNVVSLLELVEIAELLAKRPLALQFVPARTGDQRYFAADHRRFTQSTGWRPRVGASAGIARLWESLAAEAARKHAPPRPEPAAGATYA